jgi:DNA-binding transcriptional LysR family regulator
MSVLQSELKLRLFRPLGRGLELTESGKEVYLQSKKIIEALDQLQSKNIKPVLAHPKVGMAEIFLLALAGPVSAELKACDLFEIDAGDAEMKVLQGEIDFAVSFVPFPHRDLEYLKVKKAQLGVFYTNPKFKKMPLSEIPFVAPVHEMKSNPLSIKSRDGWPVDVPRNITFGAGSLATAIKIVKAGNAAIFMPKFLGRDLTEFEVKKSLLDRTERDIFLVKKKNADEDQIMKLVARLIRKYC